MLFRAPTLLAAGIIGLAIAPAAAVETNCYAPIWDELAKEDVSGRQIRLNVDEVVVNSQNDTPRFRNLMTNLATVLKEVGEGDPRPPLNFNGNVGFDPAATRVIFQICHRPGEGQKAVCNARVLQLGPAAEANDAKIVDAIKSEITSTSTTLPLCKGLRVNKNN